VSTVRVGTGLPEWSAIVRPEHMTAFSLITQDPNPIHWSREAVQALGLGDRLVNQGGLNVSYLVNAVAAWPGVAARVRSLRVRFLGNVFEGDTVRVTGTVVAVRAGEADLDVALIGAGDAVVLSGTTTVRLLDARSGK
jgi:acyl dehydratase